MPGTSAASFVSFVSFVSVSLRRAQAPTRRRWTKSRGCSSSTSPSTPRTLPAIRARPRTSSPAILEQGRHPGHALRVGAGQGDHLRAAEGDRLAAGGQGDPAAPPHGRRAGRPHAVEDRSVHADDPGRRAVGPRLDGHEGPGRRAAGGVPDAEAAERAADARRHPAGRARRGGRRRARRALDDREPLRRARSRVRDRRGRLRQHAICSRRTRWSTASRWPRRRSSG